MPIIPAWEMRGQDDADARFIAILSAMRTFNDEGKFDVETMRGHIGELAQDDMAVIARAMSFAQWISGTTRLPG